MRCLFYNLFKISIIFFIFFFTPLAFSAEEQKVNILTWWGYLVSPWVQQMVTDKCHVTISYDEYHSNADFIRRFHEYKEFYDILIFPDMDYQALKNEIKRSNGTIYKNADSYEKNIKLHYLKNNYPSNIAYFLISFNGFLYNPKTIQLSESDTIYSIFKKAKSKTVVLSEEPIYVFNLLNMNANYDSAEKAFSIF